MYFLFHPGMNGELFYVNLDVYFMNIDLQKPTNVLTLDDEELSNCSNMLLLWHLNTWHIKRNCFVEWSYVTSTKYITTKIKIVEFVFLIQFHFPVMNSFIAHVSLHLRIFLRIFKSWLNRHIIARKLYNYVWKHSKPQKFFYWGFSTFRKIYRLIKFMNNLLWVPFSRWN